MADFDHYKPLLDKIAGSKILGTGNDAALLTFLVKATVDGKALKETIIAIDFFGRDSSFDPSSDSIVRSNVFNLRKKLESYYIHEGINDQIRFEIPKGSYQVSFVKAEKRLTQSSALKQWGMFGLVVLLAIYTLFISYQYYSGSRSLTNHNPYYNNPVWSYYLNSENPVLIVLGDYFMIERIQFPDSSNYFIRNPKINTQTDFSEYLDRNPEMRESTKKLGQSYFGEEIPRIYHQLSDILGGIDKEVRMKYSSELSLQDIREYDIIFAGDFATLGILKPFFENSGLKFSSMPTSIYILDDQQDTTDYFLLYNPINSVFQNDYAVVSSISGYTDNRILFFLSFLPFGKSEALYKLTDELFISQLEPDLFPLPNNWNLLLKVSGLQSAGFFYEILRFYPIE